MTISHATQYRIYGTIKLTNADCARYFRTSVGKKSSVSHYISLEEVAKEL